MTPLSLRAFWHRFLFALVLAFVLTASGIGGAYWLANDAIDSAPRTDVDLDDQDEGEPANFLIIGSDTRAFVEDALDAEHFGESEDAGGQRSDTIMIAHIDPDSKTGLLVSFPRDLWVDIPGLGGSKINAAFNQGPQRVIDTIQSNFDVEIHHYLEVNFDGFREVVGAIGRVPIFFPTPARDVLTGLLVERSGCHELDGEQALQYVRSREYQYFEDGEWNVDPGFDLGRIRRQQYFIRSLAKEAVSASVRNPTKVDNIVNRVVANLTLDPDLGLSDLRALARTFREVDPGVVEMITLPTRPERIEGQAALRLVDEQAAPIFERLRFGTREPVAPPPSDVAPADVRVAVRNGSGVDGAARRVLDAFSELGFGAVEPPSNADRSDYEVTEVRHGPDSLGPAQLVLAHLDGAGRLVEVDTVPEGADVVVVIGADFDGLVPPEPAPSPDTAPSVTSTTVGLPPNPGGDQPLPFAGC